METPLRTFLRLHVEAVWGVKLPPLIENSVDLLQEGIQPSWKLYVAALEDTQMAIWRPDVAVSERNALFRQASAALTLPPTVQTDPAISREVVLHQVAVPTMRLATAGQIARPLTPDDQALVEYFEPGSSGYYFHPDRHPLIGISVEGHLLSLAHSSRRTTAACELGIDTLPAARRKGYALAATLLWAAQVKQEQLVPFYSASAENTASLGLAAAAGYRAFARAASLE